jgi:hypothetical protein
MQEDLAGLFVFDIMLGIKDSELAKDPTAMTISCQTILNLLPRAENTDFERP